MSHAGTDLASTIIVISPLIFLGVCTEMCPDSKNWSWKMREEGYSLVEQHCHLMVRVHPYKVCSDALIPSVQGRRHQVHASRAAENPGKYANFTSLLPSPSNRGPVPGLVSRQGFRTPTSNLSPVPFSPVTILLLPPRQSLLSPLQGSSVNSHFLKLR